MTTAAELAGLAIGPVFDVFGQPAQIASGAASGEIITVVARTETEMADLLGRPVSRDALALRIRAADMAKVPDSTAIDLLDADGVPTERRIVQGEPAWADSRRLTAVIDTRPG